MIENVEKAPLQAWKRNLQGTFLNCVFLPLVLLVLSNYNTQTSGFAFILSRADLHKKKTLVLISF